VAAVRLRHQRHVEAVVDEEEGSGIPADRCQPARPGEYRPGGGLLVPVLEDPAPSLYRFRDRDFQCFAGILRVDGDDGGVQNPVEPFHPEG
jgi:hypothetical protein